MVVMRRLDVAVLEGIWRTRKYIKRYYGVKLDLIGMIFLLLISSYLMLIQSDKHKTPNAGSIYTIETKM